MCLHISSLVGLPWRDIQIDILNLFIIHHGIMLLTLLLE